MSQDETDFAEFFRTSWDPCLRAVAAGTGDLERSEEQLAEAFARAWGAWRKLRRHPAPRAWVVRTALNVGVSSWRRRRRELPLNTPEVVPAAGPGAGLDPDVLSAVRRLPTRQREVIALRVVLDLDVETTARQLGIAPGTVRAHLSRALTTLHQDLAEAPTTEEDPCPTSIR